MNNEKLKIALCGYLPYGAKGLNQANIICSLEEVRMTDCIWRPDKTLFRGQAYFKVKPLLFPTSALCKEIQLADYNNGEPFVPIVEMFKERHKGYKNIEKPEYMEWQIEDYPAFKKVSHGACSASFAFEMFNPLNNPTWIIELLNRWKIDYRGLIAEGLAIEVNESNNPYK